MEDFAYIYCLKVAKNNHDTEEENSDESLRKRKREILIESFKNYNLGNMILKKILLDNRLNMNQERNLI